MGDGTAVAKMAVTRWLSETSSHGQSSFFTCLLLSLMAGLSTTIGAGVVLLLPGNKVRPQDMAFILAFSAGVMLTTSALEFWMPALMHSTNSERLWVVIYTLLGIFAFLVFETVMPEPASFDKESPRPSGISPLPSANSSGNDEESQGLNPTNI